ncbi:MAG TPA: hypothetical protein VHD90_06550 [Phototrophicaceae bacterium]|nr:hypothetical protein [Phototrophicaceae bacterium]
MRRWQWVGIGIVIVVALVIGVFLLIVGGNAPVVSGVGKQACVTSTQQGSATCLRFPVISGDNLNGQSVTLPAVFKGKTALVIIPFDENQQVSAQTWLPLARDLASSSADFVYYNVPIFPSMAAPMRTLIRAGMVATISDAQLRAITITVFLDDRDQFLSSLNIADVSAMQVFLLDGDGDVIWRGSGVYTDAQGDTLHAALTD